MDYIPNQKIVKVNREKVIKGLSNGRLFLVAYQDNLMGAMKNLSHTAFKVYLYFLLQKDGYSVAFSPEYLHKSANMCKDTARNAFKELVSKGYIDENDRGYEFYEQPKKSPQIIPVGEKREFVDSETGEIFLYSFNQLVSVVGAEQAKELWEDDNNVGESE